MEPQIDTREIALTRAELRHALLVLQRERLAGALTIGWLGLVYFLVSVGGLSVEAMVDALAQWWTLAAGVALFHAGAVWLPTWRASGRPHYRALLAPVRYRFDARELCATTADGNQSRRPYRTLRGARRIGHLLAIRQDDGRYFLIPRRAFPDPETRATIEQRLGHTTPSFSHSPPTASPWSRLGANLRAGLGLVLLRKGWTRQLAASPEQVPLLALVSLAIALAFDRLAIAGPAALDPYAFERQAAQVLALMLATLWVCRLLRWSVPFLPMLVLLLSVEPFFSLGAGLLDQIPDDLLPIDGAIQALYLLLFLWILRVWLHALGSLSPERPTTGARGVLALFAVGVLPFWWLPDQGFWYPPYGPETGRSRVNVEETYYAQPDLMRRALDSLAPERPGETDLYFLGFGGDAAERVFRREVEHAQRVVDARLDTRGRSLLLVNDPQTVEQIPIASVSNLRIALEGLATIMNPEEDILFVYLTSHGSKNLLAVDFEPLGLNMLDPSELRDMLDESGIRWRVVVVSACYSGSFVGELKGPGTLVMTASAADRASFGCSNENEYTYFGEALFNYAFARTRSFTEAFALVSQRIAERERAEHEIPSLPQLWVGDRVEDPLGRLQRRLEGSTVSEPSDCQANPHAEGKRPAVCDRAPAH